MSAQVARADCLRCGAPAHPTTGYCSRWCAECAAYEREQRARGPVVVGQGPPIVNLDPPEAAC